jgi:hypothetical protein
LGPAAGLDPAVNLRSKDRTLTCRSFNVYQIRIFLVIRGSRIECVRALDKPIRNSQIHALLIFNVNFNICETFFFLISLHIK